MRVARPCWARFRPAERAFGARGTKVASTSPCRKYGELAICRRKDLGKSQESAFTEISVPATWATNVRYRQSSNRLGGAGRMRNCCVLHKSGGCADTPQHCGFSRKQLTRLPQRGLVGARRGVAWGGSSERRPISGWRSTSFPWRT
jgi:hypothetical protein